jgi:NAD(P)-dependent dehydrogenase (short-subunit alcohol dehydrogenase family)
LVATGTLSNNIAIISGGAGDIGSAIARELARLGADVALGDVRPLGSADALLGELRGLGRRVRYDCVDVADSGAVEEWVRDVTEDLGVPSLVIPNAAVVTLKRVCEMTPEEWDRDLRVNLNGAFYTARECARRLVEGKMPGRIVFVGSWAAHAVHTDLPAYCVAKAGLRMLCRCMALELAPAGILVNEVAPGFVDAGLSGRIFAAQPERREASLRQVPTGLLIEAEEVAREVAHLCDPANRHMTGSVLLMDGGLSLVSPGGARND